jgi:hypothetical protein
MNIYLVKKNVTVPQEDKSDKEKKKYLSSSSIRGLIGNTAFGFPSYHLGSLNTPFNTTTKSAIAGPSHRPDEAVSFIIDINVM